MGKTCSQRRGGLVVYMCAACARQGGAGQRTQGTAARVAAPWLDGGMGGGCEREGLEKRASLDVGGWRERQKGTAARLLAGRSVGRSRGCSDVKKLVQGYRYLRGGGMLTVMGTLRVRYWKT
jgi:hypothetical protein